jgi:catalase (peroxidase I)
MLLQPIKLKYGDALSWGDLIVLAGTTAIEDMGGPVLGFCGGRIDDMDGTASMKLGPTAEQAATDPCPTNGNCSLPIGTTTIGLIYVNPEGPMGVPDPVASFPQVRDSFSRMAMNDSETVALIGGGHAFGKTHGACTLGPGPAPDVQPENSWPGLCGSGSLMGKANNTFTSGFEGPWTHTPTQWSNRYFNNLIDFNWTNQTGPGGKQQWQANGTTTMMLTTDISLLHDENYSALVTQFANDLGALNNSFAHAWYKLVSRDMGPRARCTGNNIPPAQSFQNPLPATPSVLANFTAVKQLIVKAMHADSTVAASLVHLAYQCASTFRQTDYQGGCNGASIRFAPQNTWSVNNGTGTIISWLNTSVKNAYSGTGYLSYADTIVLAGQAAVEFTSGMQLTFCPGRTDASDGLASQYLTPRSYNDSNVTLSLLEVRDLQEISGLTARQWVVLHGRLRSSANQVLQGYSGSWTTSSTLLSNAYFSTLLNNTWQLQTSASGLNEYAASGVYMTPHDVALIWDAEYLAIVQEYASNNTLFLQDFASTWTTLMNIDRFDGPTGNLCNNITAITAGGGGGGSGGGGAPAKTATAYSTITNVSQDPGIWIMVGIVVILGVGFLFAKKNDPSRH